MSEYAFKKYDYKVALLDSIFQEYVGQEIQVLDMGSGTSKDFVDVLRKYPNVQYTGIECDAMAQNKARQLFEAYHNVRFITQFGEQAQAEYANYYDLTISLSVLEHVKQLPAFLLTSIAVTKPGGQIIHRYDLGHALHSNWYERLKVWCCQHFPVLIPARHFTTYPEQHRIIALLQAHGVAIQEVLYSQMPNLKGMMNRIAWEEDGATVLSQEIITFEDHLSRYMRPRLSVRQMEYFFPAITIMGMKCL